MKGLQMVRIFCFYPCTCMKDCLCFGIDNQELLSSLGLEGYMFASPGSTKGGRGTDTPYLMKISNYKLDLVDGAAYIRFLLVILRPHTVDRTNRFRADHPL